MEALTQEQLLGITEAEDDTAVWIYEIQDHIVTRAIIDYDDEKGILGIWCADNTKWFTGKEYTKTWLAYREKPSKFI